MQPRYLVLLAAYNGMEWISDQVKSILDQNHVLVTLMISVDSSSDGTEQWVTDLAKSDPRVKCLAHGKKFGGAAPNFFRLVHEAPLGDFDYFSFADQDDIWLPNKLIQAHRVMSVSGADGYSSNVTAFWPDGRESLIIKSQPQVEYDRFFEAAGPCCTYVFSRKLFIDLQRHVTENLKWLHEVSLHDWYCYAFSRTHKYKWLIDTHSYMRYRQHTNNQVGVNAGVKAFRTRFLKVLDGWWLSQAALISRLNGVEDSPFVQSWIGLGRVDLVRLALAGHKCRRRFRDKFVFTAFCITLVFLRQKK